MHGTKDKAKRKAAKRRAGDNIKVQNFLFRISIRIYAKFVGQIYCFFKLLFINFEFVILVKAGFFDNKLTLSTMVKMSILIFGKYLPVNTFSSPLIILQFK